MIVCCLKGYVINREIRLKNIYIKVKCVFDVKQIKNKCLSSMTI